MSKKKSGNAKWLDKKGEVRANKCVEKLAK